MKNKTIIIEKKEYELLKRIMGMAQYYKDKSYKNSIEKLCMELQSARIVKNKEMPEDVVRFNSVVVIKTPFNASREYQIVTPQRSDIREGKISVLAPMGLALFGYSQGDEIAWEFPTGMSSILIEKVKQEKLSPEEVINYDK